QSRFADAQAAFADYLGRGPSAPIRRDAQLCLGMAQVQMGQYPEALATLRPLTAKDQEQAPQALFWISRALQNPNKPDGSGEFKEGLTEAQKSLKRCAEFLADGTKKDVIKKQQRGEALLELAAVQQLGGEHADAVKTLQQIADDGLLPNRAEDLTQKRI